MILLRELASLEDNRSKRMRQGALLAVIALTWTGCNAQPARIEQAQVDTAAVAANICRDFDQDNSGGLSLKESAACPAVASVFKSYDANGDKELSAEEISERLEKTVFDPRQALFEVSCFVQMRNKPISGATVTLTPLSYFEDSLSPSQGVSDEQGLVKFSLAEEDLPENAPRLKGFIQPGLYQVSITHPTQNVPGDFGSGGNKSVEVSPTTLANGALKFDISGR